MLKKIFRKPWFLFFLLILFIPLSSHGSLTPSDIANKKYRQAYAYYNNLVRDTSKAKIRKNWLKGIQLFQKIYRADPDNDIAPSCLFMLGRIYYDMYRWSGNPLDIDESIAYYEDVASIFSKHRLADDALYAVGRIILSDKNDPERAARIFAKVAAVYPDSDMAPTAAGQLKKIKGSKQSQSEDKSAIIIADTPGKKSVQGVKTTLLPIRYWSSPDHTRVVLETTGPVSYKEHILKKSSSLPRRLFLDLQKCTVPKNVHDVIPVKDGLLKQIRSGQHNSEDARVVLDIQSISDYKIFSLKAPYRVVIDVFGEKGEPWQAANVSKTSVPSLPQQLGLGVRKIVIDPGHGGKDTGAIGPHGLKEKDVVLKIAKSLAKTLKNECGYQVVLTRKRDVFVPLEKRTYIANDSNADLFFSIHVNAAPSKKVRGIETYYLDLTDDPENMKVAARENASSTANLSDLQAILSDLIQNTKLNESAKLAEVVQANLVKGLSNKYRGINNLGVKRAPFIVLTRAQMPAVLAEVAFISNPREEKMLKNDAFLSDIAVHMAKSITQYASELNLAYLNISNNRQ